MVVDKYHVIKRICNLDYEKQQNSMETITHMLKQNENGSYQQMRFTRHQAYNLLKSFIDYLCLGDSAETDDPNYDDQ